jgi:hypothetical protein
MSEDEKTRRLEGFAANAVAYADALIARRPGDSDPCPVCHCLPCVCSIDEAEVIVFTAGALPALLRACERAHGNACATMGPQSDLARCLRAAIHEATGGEPDVARAAMIDGAAGMLAACESVAAWLEEVAEGIAWHGGCLPVAATGLAEQATVLRRAAAKARVK